MTDHPDYDAEIAKAVRTRDQLQARYDAVKHGFDASSIIDRRHALNEAERQLRMLRGAKAADRPLESMRNSSIFYGSNS
jgi:hypothetical protein